MTMSSSRLSYSAEYDLMQKALAEPKGLRTPFEDRASAYTYRLRLNRARQLERKLNKEAFKPGTKMHGASIYDELIFTIQISDEGTDDQLFWVYLKKALAPTHVETIE
mgnify:CR=1 FL=1